MSSNFDLDPSTSARLSTTTRAPFKLLDLLDPSAARLAIAGLFVGGAKRQPARQSLSPARYADAGNDWRVKLSLAKNANYFYKDDSRFGILAPLRETDGVIFPNTPTVGVTHTAKYSPQSLTHTNYSTHTYEGSEVQAFSISGEFTAQTGVEAAYVLACIQFFRSATKMWFGSGSNIGNPPPMVFLTGYGAHYFPNVPCVVTSFTHTMPAECDYIEADTGTGDVTMIPTTSTLAVTVQPVYSRTTMTKFNLDEFAAGKMIGSKKQGYGGFI